MRFETYGVNLPNQLSPYAESIHGLPVVKRWRAAAAAAPRRMRISIPMNMLSFRQPKDLPKKLRGMIKQLYGDGLVAKATDGWRKLRTR